MPEISLQNLTASPLGAQLAAAGLAVNPAALTVRIPTAEEIRASRLDFCTTRNEFGIPKRLTTNPGFCAGVEWPGGADELLEESIRANPTAFEAAVRRSPELQARLASKLRESQMSQPPFGATPGFNPNAPNPFANGLPAGTESPSPAGFLDDIFGTISGGIGSVIGGIGGILGQVGSAANQILPVLQPLAQAGIIRGSVGQALTTPPNGAAAMPTMAPSADNPFVGGQPVDSIPDLGAGSVQNANFLLELLRRGAGALGAGAAGAIGFEGGNALLERFGFGGDDPMNEELLQLLAMSGPAFCPQLFKPRRAGFALPSRIQVTGPDGNIYVLANLGRATRGSREASVLKRLAKDNNKVVRNRLTPGR